MKSRFVKVQDKDLAAFCREIFREARMAKKITKRQQAWRRQSFTRNELLALKIRVYRVSRKAGAMVQALMHKRKLGS